MKQKQIKFQFLFVPASADPLCTSNETTYELLQMLKSEIQKQKSLKKEY